MAKPTSINHPILKQMQVKRKPSKYRNVRTEYDGRLYDSKGEANRAATLDTLKRAGQIRHWEPQPTIRLGCSEITLRADFLVWHLDGTTHVEDYKGVWTAKFKERVKLWRRFGPAELHVVSKKGTEIIRPDWMEGVKT